MSHIRFANTTIYNEHDGYSRVVKNTQYGTFSGEAWCESEDRDIQNRWDGMYIAEFYCDRKIQRAKAKEFSARARGIEHAYNILLNSLGEEDKGVKLLKRQLDIAQREAKTESNKYHNMALSGRDYVGNIVTRRREFREKYGK